MTRHGVRPNRLKTAMAEGRVATGFHMTFYAPVVIDLIGTLPFDLVYLDTEHGTFDLAQIEASCRAAELADVTVISRVPSLDAHLIAQYAAAGVQGIIVPHVETQADAEAAVDACFVEPVGHRPSGPSRANRFWRHTDDLPAAMREANDAMVLAVQIESARAVENLDAILAVDHIDYVVVGKSDLSQSLGFPRQPRGFHPDAMKVIADVEARIRARRRLRDDIMRVGRVRDFILKGAESFVSP